MVFAALTEEGQLTCQAIRSFHDIDVAVLTNTKIVRHVFVAIPTATSQYHHTARDTADRPVSGVAMETVDNTSTAATPTAPFLCIRISCRGIGVFPISNPTAKVPDRALYVDAAANGCTLDSTGNVIVARTIVACRFNGEIDPNNQSYVWADYDPKKY